MPVLILNENERCDQCLVSPVCFVKHGDGKFYHGRTEVNAVVDAESDTLAVDGVEYFVHRTEPYLVHDDPETIDLDHYCLRKSHGAEYANLTWVRDDVYEDADGNRAVYRESEATAELSGIGRVDVIERYRSQGITTIGFTRAE